MKVLSTTGLTKLIELCKDTFIDKNNTVDISSILSTVATTGSYADLTNKPSINSVTLSGDKTSSDLGLQDTLVDSGDNQNIKTINNKSILGSGNITVSSLPSQSGQSGKFLTTNGTAASWSAVSYNNLTNKLTAGTDISISNSNVVSCTHPEVYLSEDDYQDLVDAGTVDPNTYYNTDDATQMTVSDLITRRESMNPGDQLAQGYLVLVEVQ